MAPVSVPPGSTFFDVAALLRQLDPAHGGTAASMQHRLHGLFTSLVPAGRYAYERVADLLLEIDRIGAADPQPCTRWWSGYIQDGRLAFPSYVSRCHGCQRLMYADSLRLHTCTSCQRRAEKNKKRRQRGTDLAERLCEHCGSSFTPKRSDARYCGGACRAAASRNRVTETVARASKAEPGPPKVSQQHPLRLLSPGG